MLCHYPKGTPIRRPVTRVESSSRRNSPHTDSQVGNVSATERTVGAASAAPLEESSHTVVDQPVPPSATGTPGKCTHAYMCMWFVSGGD